MTMIPTDLALVGAVAFGLHFLGKWRSTPLPFIRWITAKDNVIYFVSSLLLCALALLLQPELSAALGMQPLTYAAIMCYGGGHAVSRFLEIKGAETEKRAKA